MAQNGDLLVADQEAFGGTGGVIRVNPATGARSTVSSNASRAGGPSFADPQGIALAQSGDILVADPHAFGSSGGVIRVNPMTGARSTVSSNTSPPKAPFFAAPVAVALAHNGDILVADAFAPGGMGGLIRVNPSTGARTTVSSNASPTGGPDFTFPTALAVVPGAHDTPAPVISRLLVAPKALATKRSRRHRRAGTSFRYTLSEAARVVFTIEKKTRGRRVGGKCRQRTQRNRKARRCTRYKRSGSFSQQGAARRNRKRFSGKLRGKPLPSGSYRATLLATDAAGNVSKRKRVGFRVLR
ncbi:MAG: hypothetical protein LC790_18655 [Actinobacteria bacterium]|nr:hypothetical protein [Actinomycetota bacterium]